LVLTLNITFPEQAYPSADDPNPAPDFVGPHEVYAWGTSVEGLATGQVDLGSLVLSQGQDFTLTLGASESVALGTNASLRIPAARRIRQHLARHRAFLPHRNHPRLAVILMFGPSPTFPFSVALRPSDCFVICGP
jgi:hypothetical protein